MLHNLGYFFFRKSARTFNFIEEISPLAQIHDENELASPFIYFIEFVEVGVVQFHRYGDLSNQFLLLGLFAVHVKGLDDLGSPDEASHFHFYFGDDAVGALPDVLDVDVVSEVVGFSNFDEGVSLNNDFFNFDIGRIYLLRLSILLIVVFADFTFGSEIFSHQTLPGVHLNLPVFHVHLGMDVVKFAFSWNHHLLLFLPLPLRFYLLLRFHCYRFFCLHRVTV